MRAVAVLLKPPERRWECPLCPQTAVTRQVEPHSQMHTCAGLAGLTAPMVPAGTRCKVEAHEREDYVGGEIVQVDANGRPVMSVTITREDGMDCTVYPPTATLRDEDA